MRETNIPQPGARAPFRTLGLGEAGAGASGIAILYRYRTCPVQTCGRARTNLGRDLPPPEVTLALTVKRQKRFSEKADNRGLVVTEAGSYLRLVDSCITELKA